MFLPDFADPLTLPELDYGGVADRDGSAAELASYLMFLKKRDGRLKSVIFDDPWASPADLDYAGPPPEDLLTLQGKITYLRDIAEISPDALWEYRAVATSFLKIVYVSDLSPAEIRKLADEEPEDLFQRLAQSVRHVAVNAYDDESWLILRYEPEHEDHAGSCSCGGECDGDCDGDCDCGHHHPANDD